MQRAFLNTHILVACTLSCILIASCGNDSQNPDATHKTCDEDRPLCGDTCCEYACCNDVCIDTQNNPQACGGCDITCLEDEICEESSCQKRCTSPLTWCDGACVDMQISQEHCGQCGNLCDATESCQNGTCKTGCAVGFELCEDACIDLKRDSLHCGDCYTVCDNTMYCEEGQCACQFGKYDCDNDPTNGCESDLICEAACENAEHSRCMGECVDLQSDKRFCGDCNHACLNSETCESGTCVKPEPEPCAQEGWEKCYGECRDLQNDNQNCGACLNACQPEESCVEGTCKVRCEDKTMCDDACVDLQSDAQHCGDCHTACAQGQKCTEGSCQCEEGKYDCDGDISNGCESNEQCNCTPGAKRKCWLGTPESRNQGICKDGNQICDASGLFWGQCTGGVYPSAITCNDAGFLIGNDQNCDGNPDTECKSECDMLSGEFSYIGCEYWPVFLENYDGTSDNIYFDLTLVVSNPSKTEPATIYIFDKPAFEHASRTPYLTFTVPPAGVVYKTVVGDPAGSKNNLCKAGTTIYDYMVNDTAISPLAFKMRSSRPVVVYQFNPYGKAASHSSDASLLMPQHVLGKQYYSMSYTSMSGDSRHAGTISIVATEPGESQVTVTVKAPMKAGTNLKDKSAIPAMKAGETRTFKLEQFDVLTLSQSAGGNTASAEATGSYIESDKVIAVFGGAGCTNVPIGYGACDHTEEQILPLHAWGKNYAAVKTRPMKQEHDFYYLLAQSDNTTVKLSGDAGDTEVNQTFTLNAGEYKKFKSKYSFDAVADKPIYLGQFMPGINYSGATVGDPSFISAVPIEQYRTSYAFAVPNSYDYDYVTIISPPGNVIQLNGQETGGKKFEIKDITTLPKETFTGFKEFGSMGYVFGYLDVNGGVYSLEGTKPFGVIGYGFYQRTTYGYPIGLDLKRINTN